MDPQLTHRMNLCYVFLPMQYTELTHQLSKSWSVNMSYEGVCYAGRLRDPPGVRAAVPLAVLVLRLRGYTGHQAVLYT